MTRILSVFNLLKRVGFAILVLGVTNGHSQSWELMDELPERSEVECITIDAQTGSIFAGTARIFGFPECGGIYKYNQIDGIWEYKQFRETTISNILRLQNDHTYIYACTEEGLARSNDDGESWQLFDDHPGNSSNIAMSPNDSTLWAVGLSPVESTRLYLVRDGIEWELIDSSLPWTGGLGFSSTDSTILYMATNNFCYRLNLQTRVREQIFPWNFYGYRTLYLSHEEPNVFFLELHSIFRYDEETSLYDSVFFPAGSGRANRWAISSSEEITVAADSMLLEINSDLTSVDILTPPELGLGGSAIGIDTVTGIRYVAVENRIYVELPTAVDNIGRPEEFPLSVFPNPFNSSISISLRIAPYQRTTLSLYDILGREVDVFHLGRINRETIHYTAPSSLANGIYFIRVEIGEWHALQKVILLK